MSLGLRQPSPWALVTDERNSAGDFHFLKSEENDYASASFSRLKEIIKALGLDIEEKIFLPKDRQVQQVAAQHG